MSEVDLNSIAAKVIAKQITDLAESVGATLDNALKLGKLKLKVGLESYLTSTCDRLSSVKTLLHRESPVHITDIFVPLDIRHADRQLTDKDVLPLLERVNCIALTGTAGSGKSILMKHLYREAVAQRARVPIFYELKYLNTVNDVDLLKSVFESLAGALPLSYEQFRSGMRAGAFTFFFDGFDEVNYDAREQFERELLQIPTFYPDCLVIISSRPDETFSSWANFHELKVQALRKEQTAALIGKVKYDDVVKAKFIAQLDGLFQRHREFLSNPLLATMMLLTFDQFADVPSKAHIFYEQAFETLFHKHDALKAVYKRKTYTGLPVNEFKKVFAAFCALGYFEERFAFSEEQIRQTIADAIRVSALEIEGEAFLRDMLESVCLIQRDGLQFAFVHRSFQEYFTAYFIVVLNSDHIPALFDRLSSTQRHQDAVVSMAYDMAPNVVDSAWLLPLLDRAADVLKLEEGEPDLTRLLETLFVDARISFVGKHGDGSIGRPVFFSYFSGAPLAREMALVEMLFDFSIWRSEEERRTVELGDLSVFEEVEGGKTVVHGAPGDFLATLKLVMGGELVKSELIIGRPWLHPQNWNWIPRTRIGVSASTLWRDLIRQRELVHGRVAARKLSIADMLSKKGE